MSSLNLECKNVLLIDSNVQRRLRLRQACAAVPVLRKLVQCCALDEGITKASHGEDECHIVFLDNHFGQEAINKFVEQARSVVQTRDAAFIVVMAVDQAATQVAQHMIQGLDGILDEPFSVESLNQIIQLATAVKHQRSLEREKIGIRLLVNEIAVQFDMVAQLKALGGGAGVSQKTLKETCSALSTLSDEGRKFYFEELCEHFSQLPAWQSKPVYRGASQRTRARQVKRVQELAEREMRSKAEPKVKVG